MLLENNFKLLNVWWWWDGERQAFANEFQRGRQSIGRAGKEMHKAFPKKRI